MIIVIVNAFLCYVETLHINKDNGGKLMPIDILLPRAKAVVRTSVIKEHNGDEILKQENHRAM